MSQIRYITDTMGQKTDVVISTDEYSQLLEELEELKAIAERATEPVVLHSDVEKLIEDLK